MYRCRLCSASGTVGCSPTSTLLRLQIYLAARLRPKDDPRPRLKQVRNGRNWNPTMTILMICVSSNPQSTEPSPKQRQEAVNGDCC